MIVPVEKKYLKVELDPTKWTRTVGADGTTITYEASEGATVRFIEEPDGTVQLHENVGAGKKFTTSGGIANIWGLY